MKNALLWFRKDLRLHDNPALLAASRATKLLPVYVLPERELQPHAGLIQALGDDAPAKMGSGRRYFLQTALEDLHKSLKEKKSALACLHGEVPDLILGLCKAYEITDVYTTELPGTEEIQDLDYTEQLLEEAGIKLHVYESHTLYHPDNLSFPPERMPDVFTPFRKHVEKYAHTHDEIPCPHLIPTWPEHKGESRFSPETLYNEHIQLPGASQKTDRRSANPTDGGETAALNHLKTYIWEKQLVKTYKETRNGLVGMDFSSKLSGWLALGSLSPRTVYRHISWFEKQVVANDSTYWLYFELLWRDFFQFLMMKYEGKLFTLDGISGDAVLFDSAPKSDGKTFGFRHDRVAFRKWIDGRTESDFVNANMIELKETGFMSNRGRQNVASYLAKTMGVDWRWGAAWFESNLLDYDVASNWGNWAYVSGVGTDPRDRVFNVERQADMYDKSGEYRSLWLGKKQY
ncbi:MAG: DASH family cryptochrome [Bacteroidetes bacterium]|nr:DASH family cryptochrome [Bacteroidota bacterium]MCH8523499.1 DASH family cryptochrome [Balneolales bacterium]